ncbi:MAG: ATP-binding protein [Minisyncoccia bacterium]
MPVALLDIISNLSIEMCVLVIWNLFIVVLSWVIFWQDLAKRNSRIFFFLAIINLLSSFVYAILDGSFSISGVYMGIVALYAVAAIVPPFLFIFLHVFSIENSEISFQKFVAFFVPYFAIVGILYWYPSFIVSYQEAPTGALDGMVLGKGFLIYIFYIFTYLVAAIFLLVKKYQESVGILKTAIFEMLTVVGFVCAITMVMSFMPPIFTVGQHGMFWIGHFSVSLLIFATSFILIKYNSFNIKIITIELLISIIALVLITELFFANSIYDLFIRTVITLLIILSSSFLARSVKREIESEERIIRLSHNLDAISKRLKLLDKKKSEFLSIAAHHLRDPLTVIKGYASMLIEGSFGPLSHPVMDALEKISVSSGHLVVVISDFMDISRIESGDMNYKFVDVDMKKLVTDIASDMEQNALHARLVFNVMIDDGVSGNEQFITVGDSGKLRQVISNLIDNSIKYTPNGEISLLLSKSSDRKKIIFSLSDTGIGMNSMTLEKIFKKFSRGEGVNKVYTEGTGLGLYVAKEVIKKHEGRIWAESKGEGHGSSFYVELEAKG